MGSPELAPERPLYSSRVASLLLAAVVLDICCLSPSYVATSSGYYEISSSYLISSKFSILPAQDSLLPEDLSCRQV